jgi:hypothetical protein
MIFILLLSFAHAAALYHNFISSWDENVYHSLSPRQRRRSDLRSARKARECIRSREHHG